jgi:hypothetical protein
MKEAMIYGTAGLTAGISSVTPDRISKTEDGKLLFLELQEALDH